MRTEGVGREGRIILKKIWEQPVSTFILYIAHCLENEESINSSIVTSALVA
jgi:hypothetical protein